MSSGISESYAYAFYRLRNWAKESSDDSFHDWKALAAISIFEGAFIYAVVIGIGNIFDTFLLSNSVLFDAGPMAVILTLLNYFVLLHKDRWRRFEGRFREYSRSKQRTGTFLIAFTILAIVTLLIVSVANIEPAGTTN